MSIRNMLWPTRWKVTFSFLIAAVSVFLIYLLSPYYQSALFGLELSLRVLSVFLSFAIVTLIYYPLSCGLIFLFRGFRQKKRPKRQDMIMAVLLILVFNPLTFSALYLAGSYVTYYPCGAEVLGFSENSPLQMAGMQTGEVIKQVGGQAIDGTQSLTAALAGKSPGEFVRVKTDQNEYDIQLGQNPETNRTIMGVITHNAYCRRW